MQRQAVEPEAPRNWLDKVSEGPGTPIQGAEVLSDPNRSGGFWRNFAAGGMLPDQRIAFFASQRFPNEPIDEAIKRYGYNPDNDAVYWLDDKGNENYERSSWLDSFGRGFAEAIPAVTGLLGATAGTPMGWVGMGAGSVMGASGGKYALRVIGDAMSGVPSSVWDKIGDASTEGLLDLVATGAGKLIVKGFKSPIFDALKKDKTLRKDTEKFMEVAREKFGIDLTWAEASNLQAAVKRQDYLANTAPESAEKIRDRYLKRMPQIQAAVDDFVQRVSPSSTMNQAANDMVGAARRALDDEAAKITATTGPMYRQAYQTQPEVPTDGIRQAIADLGQTAVGDFRQFLASTLKDIPEGKASTELVHNVRKHIDKAMRGGISKYPDIDKQALARLEAVRAPIDKTLKAIPGFAAADTQHAAMSTVLEAMQKSLPGNLASQTKPDIAGLAGMLFERRGVDPAALRAVKSQIMAVPGGAAAWDGMVKWHIAQQWDKATRNGVPGEVRNLGRSFVSALWGDGRGKKGELLKAAVEHHPTLKKDLQTLVDVLSATGRAIREGSQTAGRLGEAQAIRREAMASTKTGQATRALRGITLELPTRAADFVEGVMVGRYNEQIADALFEPDFKEALKMARKNGPKSQAAIQGTLRALIQTTDAFSETSDQAGLALDEYMHTGPGPSQGQQLRLLAPQ